ncbi:hypothetical protein QLQ12_00030 [Actinoplanes sp. NEAU-A12]|uniref:Transposase IS111A/IS1328/IS1533 N-terminal domain-containing protein n=1 Tax=Actinoplanes sandaracinus TaxID=3045177 RepID=A0ABT6WB82_9ACTN|nr:hypothetical protein [Actinoplanes sandaracinus]MDI6096994.1 hypothetical protein [Actinoplanes sandaracinus]
MLLAQAEIAATLAHARARGRGLASGPADGATRARHQCASSPCTCSRRALSTKYWQPFYYILEAHGVTVWLGNANDVKQVPGRPKTDLLDAV